jgi:hypothetical protein
MQPQVQRALLLPASPAFHLHQRASFEGRESFMFMQQAAGQGHLQASICLALANLRAATTHRELQNAFSLMMVQANKGSPAAQHCIAEILCSGCCCSQKCGTLGFISPNATSRTYISRSAASAFLTPLAAWSRRRCGLNLQPAEVTALLFRCG